MTSRQTQTVLRAATVALWAAAAAVVAGGLLVPVRPPPADPVATALPPASRPATAPAVTFDDLLDLSLRRPAVDPPAAAPAVAATTAPAGPDVRLAGIVAEPGHSFAVFVTAAGATEVRTVGQRAGGAEVLAISPAAVTVRYAGQSLTQRLPARRGRDALLSCGASIRPSRRRQPAEGTPVRGRPATPVRPLAAARGSDARSRIS